MGEEMMRYTFTRDEDILQHHGILGQKWGIRRYQNSDGTLTDEGKKRYSDNFRDNWRNASYDASPEEVVTDSQAKNDFKKIHANLADSKKELDSISKEAETLMKPFDYDEQARCSAISSLVNNGDESMSDCIRNMWFYAYEDGDQGRTNATTVYLHNNGLEDKAKDIYSRYDDARKNYKANAESMVNELLGDHANDSVNPGISQYTVGKAIATSYLYSDEKGQHLGIFNIGTGLDGAMTKETSDSIAKATKIVDKLGINSDNLWKNDSDAIDWADANPDKRVSNMTDSDWDDLAKIINA